MIDFIFILFVILYFIYIGAFIPLKTILFFFLALFPLFDLKKYNFIPISKDFLNITFIWFIYFIFNFILSIINGFELPTFKVFFNIYFLIPFSYTCAQLVSNKFTLLKIYKLLILITFLINMTNYALLFLDFYGFRDNTIINAIFTDKSFGALVNISGSLMFRSQNVIALIYLIPLNFHLLFKSYHSFSIKFQNLLKANIFTGLIIVFLSGRRALQYVAILSFLNLLIPIFIKNINLTTIPIKKFKNIFKPNIFNLALLALFIFLFSQVISILTENISLDILISRFTETFLAPFDSSSTGTMVRSDQYTILFNGWLESPIIGHGLTSFPDLYFRGGPSFEAILHAMLYQTGILGTSIYFAFIYYCLFGKSSPSVNAILNQNKNHAIPFATFWFLLASLTNPFGYNVVVWVLLIYYRINIKKINT